MSDYSQKRKKYERLKGFRECLQHHLKGKAEPWDASGWYDNGWNEAEKLLLPILKRKVKPIHDALYKKLNRDQEYKEYRVYTTGERALDVKIDCCTMVA